MQDNLFPTGATARPADLPTAQAAGRRPSTDSELHQSILRCFADGYSFTDDEVCAVLFPERCAGTVIKRCSELRKAGLLVDSGHTRPTRTGSQAIVWRLASGSGSAA